MKFEGFHLSQPSYWCSDSGMIIVTCEKCKVKMPMPEPKKGTVIESIKCSQCGQTSINSDSKRMSDEHPPCRCVEYDIAGATACANCNETQFGGMWEEFL